MRYCQHLMSGGALPYHKSRTQHFPKGSRVLVPGRGEGVVRRKKFDDYTIELDDGTRAYVDVKELKSVSVTPG